MRDSSYLPRIVDSRLSEALKSFPIVMLDGPRAVGKTTTAKQVAASSLHLPEDLPLLEINAAATLASLEPPILIDEWQLAGTDLLWTLKRMVDADPTPGRFILTGSVEPTSYGPTYPLTGRAVNLLMYPMTSAELAGTGNEATFLQQLTGQTLPAPTAGRQSSFTLDTLFTSGFPATRQLSDQSMFLNGYASVMAQRAGDEGRDASRLLRAMAVLGVLTAQAVPDQRIWESADVNKATWKAYEDLLRRVHISTPVHAYSSNALKRITSYPKQYLADTALALALANLTIDDIRSDLTLAGRYIESHAVQQLRPQAATAGGRIWHLRNKGGEREVDLIVDVNGRKYAMEVKAGSRPTAADAKHLKWLHREIGNDLELSLVLHTGGDSFQLDDQIWAAPIDLL